MPPIRRNFLIAFVAVCLLVPSLPGEEPVPEASQLVGIAKAFAKKLKAVSKQEKFTCIAHLHKEAPGSVMSIWATLESELRQVGVTAKLDGQGVLPANRKELLELQFTADQQQNRYLFAVLPSVKLTGGQRVELKMSLKDHGWEDKLFDSRDVGPILGVPTTLTGQGLILGRGQEADVQLDSKTVQWKKVSVELRRLQDELFVAQPLLSEERKLSFVESLRLPKTYRCSEMGAGDVFGVWIKNENPYDIGVEILLDGRPSFKMEGVEASRFRWVLPAGENGVIDGWVTGIQLDNQGKAKLTHAQFKLEEVLANDKILAEIKDAVQISTVTVRWYGAWPQGTKRPETLDQWQSDEKKLIVGQGKTMAKTARAVPYHYDREPIGSLLFPTLGSPNTRSRDKLPGAPPCPAISTATSRCHSSSPRSRGPRSRSRAFTPRSARTRPGSAISSSATTTANSFR